MTTNRQILFCTNHCKLQTLGVTALIVAIPVPAWFHISPIPSRSRSPYPAPASSLLSHPLWVRHCSWQVSTATGQKNWRLQVRRFCGRQSEGNWWTLLTVAGPSNRLVSSHRLEAPIGTGPSDQRPLLTSAGARQENWWPQARSSCLSDRFLWLPHLTVP